MNRLEWVLGIFLVVLLLAVLGMAVILWTQPRDPAPGTRSSANGEQAALVAPTPVFAGETARAAFARAEAQAQTWQDDVMLLRADATWPQGTPMLELLDGSSTWAFTFYSPSQEAIRQVTVMEDKVTLLAERAYRPSQPLLSTAGWQIDSSSAVQSFLVHGGQDFMQEEGITSLTISLRTDNHNGRITWFVSSVATETDNSLMMDIDAHTGEVLEINRVQ
jgi:hypothetical protein